MTFYTLTKPGGPWVYQALGFTAVNGAVLDGSASTPAITSAPGPEWSVGGSVESGITRFASPSYVPGYTEPADGAGSVWDATNNQWVPTAASLSATYAGLRTRRAVQTFGMGGSQGTANLNNINMRIPFRLPVTTTRSRVLIANWDIKNSVAGGAGQLFRGAWIGPHVMGLTEGTGTFPSTPTVAVADPNAAIPNDGTYYTSPWVTAAGAQIPANTDYLLSIQTTAAAASAMVKALNSTFISFSAATGGSTAPGVAQFKYGVLDVLVEYEFVTTMGQQKVGLYVGDSVTEGAGGDATAGNYAYTAWPGAHGLLVGHATINNGLSGARVQDFSPGTGVRWSRLSLSTDTPDYAVIMLGLNDCTLGTTLATYQTNMQTLVNLLRNTYGIQRIYAGLVTPWDGIQGTLTANSSIGATSVSSTVSIPSGTAIIVGNGGAAETVTTTGAPAGTGPYTIPVPALANAHTSGDTIITLKESLRQSYNTWLRSIPLGLTGIVDTDTALRDATNPIAIRADWVADNPHPSRAGMARLAAVMPKV